MRHQSVTNVGQTMRTYAWLIAITGLILFIGSNAIYLLNRLWPLQFQLGSDLNRILLLAGTVGGILLLGAGLLRPDAVRMALTGRPVRYSSNAVLMSLIFIGILALINLLSLKYNQEYDLTKTRQFTLSEQTLQILNNLDRPVQIMGFFQTGDGRLDRARIPEGKEGVYSCRNERLLQRGDQLTLAPGQKHWFQGGPEGAVVYSFSSTVRDLQDGFTDPAVVRKPAARES